MKSTSFSSRPSSRLTCVSSSIRITFSVADIANQEFSTEDDEAFADEAYESGSSSSGQAINQSSSSSSRGTPSLAPEDRVAQSDESASHDDAEAGPESFPARLNIIVTKDGKKGALMLEAIAEDGHISIDNMFFFADKDLAEPKSFESDWKRRGVYAGPPFGNLDDELQALMDNYLGERGINDELALFIPDYIDYKEQKEYLRWLSSEFLVKNSTAPTKANLFLQILRSSTSKAQVISDCCTSCKTGVILMF